MKRRIYGKSLPSHQAASVFLLDDPGVANDRQAMDYCVDLVRWRARPATIERLLGIPTRVVTRIVLREWGEEGRLGGRVPEHVSPVFARPQLHLELSLFHRAYAEAAHITGGVAGSDGVCVPAFMTGYRYLMECTTDAREVVPENAVVLARAHHASEISLTRCGTCGMHHTQAKEVVVSGSTPTRGACPYCRLIASRSRRSVVLTPMHADQMRALLGLSPTKK